MTCRTHDYERAIRSSGHILATALVIELDPVGMADATRYLTQGRPAFDCRWAPVVSRCQTVPAGPLASTFTMPLMVWLARVVYTEPATNPAELIDESRFNDRASLERHLIERFLPAVYPRRPRPRQRADRRPVLDHPDAALAGLPGARPPAQPDRGSGLVANAREPFPDRQNGLGPLHLGIGVRRLHPAAAARVGLGRLDPTVGIGRTRALSPRDSQLHEQICAPRGRGR